MAVNKTLGVYIFENVINKKVYIGSSNNVEKRFRDHLNVNIKSGCITFRKALHKYGENNFTFRILEIVDNKDNLIEREQFYLDTILKAQDYINGINKYFIENSYNISPTASSRLGAKENEVNWRCKKVVCYDKNGYFYKIYESMKLASIDLGIQDTTIRVRTHLKTCLDYSYNFRFYTDDFPESIMVKTIKDRRPKNIKKKKYTSIKVEDINDKKIYEFDNLKQASEFLNVCNHTVKRNLNKVINSKFKIIEIS